MTFLVLIGKLFLKYTMKLSISLALSTIPFRFTCLAWRLHYHQIQKRKDP